MKSSYLLSHPLHPSIKEFTLGRTTYNTFKEKPGSDQIANPGAITFLIHILRKVRPQVIIECGSGIGTLTSVIVLETTQNSRIVTLEANDFCLEQLKLNLSGYHDRYKVITNEEDLASLKLKCDLIIADGGWMSQAEFNTIQLGTIVFAEGHRGEFRRRLDAYLSTKGLKIEMFNYCSESKRAVFFRKFAGLPIPWKIYRKCTLKGCWIGEVTDGKKDNTRPKTFQIKFPVQQVAPA